MVRESGMAPSSLEIAAGSVTGRAHARAGRCNQDAFAWASAEDVTVAVVCDGCSSGVHSEVGAQLGARLVVGALLRHLARGAEPPCGFEALLELVRLDVLAQLRLLAGAMGGSFSRTIADYFLFTVLGAAVGRERAWVFGLGDGLAVINGERLELGPYPGNQPPYLAYALLDGDAHGLGVQTLREVASGERVALLLGTDGALDLEAAAQRRVPGREELVGPLSSFWTSERYFRNPDAVRRRLAVLNRDVARAVASGEREWEAGLLPDDTTLVILRRPAADQVMS
jgi:hypothetical protein